jgi:hypothetical protein
MKGSKRWSAKGREAGEHLRGQVDWWIGKVLARMRIFKNQTRSISGKSLHYFRGPRLSGWFQLEFVRGARDRGRGSKDF